jgi:hypothetical protein
MTTMTVEEELTAFFDRISLAAPGCVRWDGIELPTPSHALVDTVSTLLYATYYTRGPALAARGRWPLAMPPLDPRRSLEPWITRANGSRDRWDSGWRVVARHRDGSASLRKGERVRVARPGEYVTDARDAAARLWAPRGRPSPGPGFSFVFGEEPGDRSDDASTMRLYFHVPATAAAALVEVVSRGLNHYQVPFRFKILNHPELYPRADAAVLYVARSCFAIVSQILDLAPPGLRQALRPEVPLFSKPHRPGIGIADDTGTHESFGSLRCRLVGEAIVDLWQRGLQDPTHRLERTRQRFHEEGLDLDHPHRAPGLVDLTSPITASRPS